MPAPPDQRPLAIAFHLTGGGQELDYMLNIRPEDLNMPNPVRMNVEQTLGGAWADIWGPGLPTITMSGHTGWRGSLLLSGVDAFFALKTVVFDEWLLRRQQQVQAGQDPGQVQLIITDALNGYTKLVAPQEFTLRRSKSRPLLYMYSIQLRVLGDAADPDATLDSITAAMNNPLRWLAGVTGLSNAVLEAQYVLSQVQNTEIAIGSSIATAVNTGISMLNAIGTLANAGQGSFDETNALILSVGQTYSMALANSFGALAANTALTTQQMLPLMQMASVWGGAACLISNSFNALPLYATYDALLGASYCSSTAGGDPPSAYALGDNPWADITPAVVAPVSVTTNATTAMTSLASGDPLLLVGQTASIGQQLQTIGTGVTVAP